MKSSIMRVFIALCALTMAQGAMGQLFPYNVWIDCDPANTEGNPPLEPYNGKGKAQEVYLGNEEFCYRIAFKCDAELSGGFLVNCFCDLNIPEADGGVGVFDGVSSDDGFCGTPGFFHLRNSKFIHACSFNAGDAELEVKAVDGEKCSDLPPPLEVSNCFFPNGSPGCDCAECEALVCAEDSFCCDFEWDQFCADIAVQNCQGLCQ
ncbi:MAG: hypothetical protein HKN57_08200 [Xanthomonadales bacterium]|nr:hypothetical protein [Gammaproteobacteria bacterium]NND57220.1 hypothetical protein [Xanthomonadales bacterium]